jgi:23S rRNA (cytidine2498-2'-O)-methyltransferase
VASFILALCKPDATKAVVDEAEPLGFTRAFSTKGLVTLKTERDVDVDTLPSLTFARFVGLSRGKSDAPAGQEPKQPKDGELVRTVVASGGGSWVGEHRHGPGRSPFFAAIMPESLLPKDAPSRAWLKLEEAARTFRLDFRAGERAIEIGSAPGGASWNLLQRGLDVIGIDPNDMDPRVAAHPNFAHLKRTSMSVDAAALDEPDWVLLDVNVPPGTALRSALPFVERARRGAVLTLKMKDWKIASEVPSWLRRIERVMPHVTARQLSTNGQEICVVCARGD